MAVTERDVEQRLVREIRRLGGWAVKWTSPGTRGVPDRLVFLPHGRLYLVELKKPGEHARVEQQAVFARLTRLGFPVHVVDDVNRFIQQVSEDQAE